MPSIRQLPDHIIAKIAAGEVIERPAYAVKELIENAIDAGSDHIQIFLEDAGLRKIMIIDNGHGMSREDIRESYKHHTTSKLDDSLIGIKTFGFRGEALSSIAAISSMVIKSKPADTDSGRMIELNNGAVIRESSVGMPNGTIIIINDLFHSVPARKKFLKSQRTEFRHVLDTVLQTAIAYPGIRFQLSHNDRQVFDFPKTPHTNERIKYLFGNDIMHEMIPVNITKSYIQINGYIASPHITITTTAKQYLFINNRNIADRLISQTVKEAYGSLVDNNSYPLFALFLSIPHEMVDVNVHPRKEQIALVNSEEIIHMIKHAIQETIQKNDLTYTPAMWKKNNQIQNMPRFATAMLRDAFNLSDHKKFIKLLSAADITQIHNVYIITPTENGILFIDQHAAHERILYEEYISIFNNEKEKSKFIKLSEAVIIHTSMTTKEAIMDLKSQLREIGFIFEEFGSDAVKITGVQEIFKDHDIRTLFLEMVDMLQNNMKEDNDTQSQKMIAYLSCRSAIMAGKKLTKKQCKELLEKLEKTPNNYTCPHGRPTKVEISLRDIHKLFKRV